MRMDNRLETFDEARSQMTPKKYLQGFHKETGIHHFIGTVNGLTHNILQTFIVVGAVAVPLLLNIPGVAKPVPTIISVVVAVAAGLSKIFGFSKRSLRRFEAYEEMNKEINSYDLSQGRYAGLDKESAFALFCVRADKMRQKHRRNIFVFDEEKQSQELDYK